MFQNNGKLTMGGETLEIKMEMFALNRKRLVERLRTVNPPKDSIVFFQGGKDVPFNDTDVNYLFRQESYFMWAFGVLEPDCFGAIEVETGKTHLFVPRFGPAHGVWMGPIHLPEHFALKYEIENVHYSDTIADVLQSLNPSVLLIMNGVNSNSKLQFQEPYFNGIDKFNLNKEILYNEIADLRVVKTDLELEAMKYVTRVSSAAHRKVMRMAKPGKYEYQCEAKFLDHVYNRGGCRNVSYTCICGTGCNSAILHYGHAGAPNDRCIRNGDLCLFDMGANYFGYAADITCTFPASGKFTPEQKLIYTAVLESNMAVMKAAKPGVNWVDMHLLANSVLLRELKNGGLLQGDVDEMMWDGLAQIFQPHGLGHLIGLDVHDVGGYLPKDPKRGDEKSGLNSLRMARNLEEGMVLTIEPGCYFIDMLLDKALESKELSKYLIPEAIKRFRGFGGVRIEDDVVITATGVKNITRVPRTVKEIEDWIANKVDDEHYEDRQ